MKYVVCTPVVLLLIFFIGCSNTDTVVTEPDYSEDEIITTEKRIEELTEEERGKEFVRYAKRYNELKTKNPDDALVALKMAAKISWWGNPLSEQWALLIFQMDTQGKVSVMDMIRRVELEIQMAEESSPYEQQVEYLKGRLEFWENRKKIEESHGRDPNEPTVRFNGIRVEDN
ncbi:hypothetical protein F4X88_14295 [Candidatus Poribacteria bacterium]|nr:hypothetical protein [Candidatus Poribacteria bacterium]